MPLHPKEEASFGYLDRFDDAVGRRRMSFIPTALLLTVFVVEIFTTDFLASAIELLYDRTIFLLNSGFTLVKSSAGSLRFMLAAKIAQEVTKDNKIGRAHV